MFAQFVNKLEEGVISFLLAAMTLLVFFEVIMRFVFNHGFMWAQELTLHLSAWMVLFGASWGIKKGTHIGVDVLVKAFPRNMRRVVTALAICCALAYCGLFGYGSWIYLKKMHLIGLEMEDMSIPRWIAHGVALVAGFSLLAWRLLVLLWKIIQDKADGFGLTDEAQDSMRLIEETRKAAAEQARAEAAKKAEAK